MHSTDKPELEPRARILAATLAGVGQRRRRRRWRNSVIAVPIVLVAVAAGVFWLNRAPLPGGVSREAAHHVQTPADPAVNSARLVIERIGDRPARTIARVSATTTIERIGSNPMPRRRVESLTDEQLLADLPSDRAAGLVRRADGSVRLIILE